MGKSIIWTHIADGQLNEVFINLLEQSQSIDIASRITKEIFESTDILSLHAEIFELDQLKKNNQGNIRAYVKHNHRISYLIEEERIFILRVRDARKEPFEY